MLNACVGLITVDVVPSPNNHRYVTAPSPVTDVVFVNDAVNGALDVTGVLVNPAVKTGADTTNSYDAIEPAPAELVACKMIV